MDGGAVSNPINCPDWRQYRREVIHRELFESIGALVSTTGEFFGRLNRIPERTLSIVGAHPA